MKCGQQGVSHQAHHHHHHLQQQHTSAQNSGGQLHSSSHGSSGQAAHQHYHHHHVHHTMSFPSPSTASGVSHYGQANCCSAGVQSTTVPGAASNSFAGSQTLPMSMVNGNGPLDSSNSCYSRTRTLPSNCPPYMANGDQYPTQWWYLSPRTTGFFFLSLVFILIWSSVISGILINRSIREQEITQHTAKLFELHRDIGQFAFDIGQEMLHSLNTSISLLDQWTARSKNQSTYTPNEANYSLPNTSLPQFNLESVRSKMNQTDETLERVTTNLAIKGYFDFESDVQNQVDKLRSICVHQLANHWKSIISSTGDSSNITLFPVLVDCVRSFQHSFHNLDNLLLKDTTWMTEKYSKLALTDLAIRSMPYTLFIRGVVDRFTTLGLGLILVKSNFSRPVNMSEYFHYYYSSRQLFLSSFSWNYRYLQRHLEIERDFQDDMETFFDLRRMQEHEFYIKMSSIFNRMFSKETLARIRNYIKKKNVESVERLMVNGKNAKYVQDANLNLLSIQLNTDLIEMMGLENIEQVTHDQEQVLNAPIAKFALKYDQLIRNQIGFIARVQDFLSNYILSPSIQLNLNEQNNLLYHSVVAVILILGVLFCLTLFLCTYCCSRNQSCSPNCPQCLSITQGTLGRRMRRRLWNLSSPFSIFKSCFSSPFSSSSSPPRYPLLYKSNHQMHYQPNNSPSTQLMSNHANRQCSVPYCSSPNSFLQSKRTLCGGIITRYIPNNVATNNTGSNSTAASPKSTGAKSEKQSSSKRSNGVDKSCTTETTSLIEDNSQSVRPSRSSCHSACCMSCSDNRCEVIVSCETDDPNGCSKCAATGKCPTCCPYNRSEDDFELNSPSAKANSAALQRRKRASSKESKQSDLSSSTLSMLSDSKNSIKSTAKDQGDQSKVTADTTKDFSMIDD